MGVFSPFLTDKKKWERLEFSPAVSHGQEKNREVIQHILQRFPAVSVAKRGDLEITSRS